MRILIPALWAACLLSTSTCDFMPNSGYGDDFLGEVEKPTVTAGKAVLVTSPSLARLGAYYCPRVSGDPLFRELCEATLGSVPGESELLFRFELPLSVDNPNSFPLPAVELLVALHLFPAEESRQVAAVCIRFCEEGDSECAALGEGTCESDEPEIRSLDDLTRAALGYLSLYVESAAAGEVPPELEVRLIPAGGKGVVTVTLDLAPDPLFEALGKVLMDRLDSIVAGEDASVSVPYAVEGAIWFVVENFGRFGVNFGPLQDEWKVL